MRKLKYKKFSYLFQKIIVEYQYIDIIFEYYDQSFIFQSI